MGAGRRGGGARHAAVLRCVSGAARAGSAPDAVGRRSPAAVCVSRLGWLPGTDAEPRLWLLRCCRYMLLMRLPAAGQVGTAQGRAGLPLAASRLGHATAAQCVPGALLCHAGQRPGKPDVDLPHWHSHLVRGRSQGWAWSTTCTRMRGHAHSSRVLLQNHRAPRSLLLLPLLPPQGVSRPAPELFGRRHLPSQPD